MRRRPGQVPRDGSRYSSGAGLSELAIIMFGCCETCSWVWLGWLGEAIWRCILPVPPTMHEPFLCKRASPFFRKDKTGAAFAS